MKIISFLSWFIISKLYLKFTGYLDYFLIVNEIKIEICQKEVILKIFIYRGNKRGLILLMILKIRNIFTIQHVVEGQIMIRHIPQKHRHIITAQNN